jgi:hypothetical protein
MKKKIELTFGQLYFFLRNHIKIRVIRDQLLLNAHLNISFQIKLFFDQRKVIPYISTSAPMTNTRAGINIRVSLAQ